MWSHPKSFWLVSEVCGLVLRVLSQASRGGEEGPARGLVETLSEHGGDPTAPNPTSPHCLSQDLGLCQLHPEDPSHFLLQDLTGQVAEERTV